jgi:hypothetical protein
MKIAAVLFILSVCYIASTEQAAIAAPVPAGVHTYPYPNRSWKEIEHKTGQQGMEGFEMNAEDLPKSARVALQSNDTEDPNCDMDCRE